MSVTSRAGVANSGRTCRRAFGAFAVVAGLLGCELDRSVTRPPADLGRTRLRALPALSPELLTEQDALDIDTSVTCELRGTWAIEMVVEAAWGGQMGGLAELTAPGRGDITVHLLSTIEDIGNDGNFSGNVRVCNAELPPFYSPTLCESYQALFPTPVWESPTMPILGLTGNVACNHPGCVVEMNPTSGLLGVSLRQPLRAWPGADETMRIECSEGTGSECFPDHDNDGQPGITIGMVTTGMALGGPEGTCGRGYAIKPPPLEESVAAIFDGVRRADRLLLGTRTTLGGLGPLTDCEHVVGAGIAQGFASRAIGCKAAEGSARMGEAPAGPNAPCTEPERMFIDENLPEYELLGKDEQPNPVLELPDDRPSVGPRFRAVRLGGLDASATCEQARTANYGDQPTATPGP